MLHDACPHRGVDYRVIAYDYEDGSGRNYQHYDLRQHRPGIGVAIGF